MKNRIKKIGKIEMVQIAVPKSKGNKDWGKFKLCRIPPACSLRCQRPIIGKRPAPKGKIRGLS